MQARLAISPILSIPFHEIELSYARSSGPGGQNVNKVNSKAVLRWRAASSPSLPEDVRSRLLERLRSRLTVQGDLVITSQRFRDAGRNAADCLEKLRSLLQQVAVPPKSRKRTRPTRGSVRRRLAAKREKSDKKRSRRSGAEE